MKRSAALSLPAIAVLAGLALAGDHRPHAMHNEAHEQMQGGGQQQAGADHGRKDADAHDHSPPGAPESDATRAYKEANAKMHRDMGAALTGDPDVDFVRGMIPHHQGAIDMAEIVLKYGKDAETRKLAESIIKAQKAEIAFMQEWLAKRGE